MPNIFTRSLIPIGDGGMAVTMPISWLRYYGLKPGDKLEVITNGDITIRPLPKGEEPAGAGAEKHGGKG